MLSLLLGHLRLHHRLEHLGEDRTCRQPSGRIGGSCRNSKFSKNQILYYLYVLETGSVELVSIELLATRHHHVEQIASPGSTTPGVGHRVPP